MRCLSLWTYFNQYISIWSLWYRVSFYISVDRFSPQKTLNFNFYSTLYPTTFPERNSHKSWHLSIETPLRQNSLRMSWKCLRWSFHLVFFCSSIVTPVLPTLLCSTCLTFLLNFFTELSTKSCFKVYSEKICQTPKKTSWWSFCGKVVGLKRSNFLKWNPTISDFVGITESMQVSDKFSSSPLMIFLNIA